MSKIFKRRKRNRFGIFSFYETNKYIRNIDKHINNAPELIRYFHNKIDPKNLFIEFRFNSFGANHINFYRDNPKMCNIILCNRSIEDIHDNYTKEFLLCETFFHEFGHYIDLSKEICERSIRPSWNIFTNDIMKKSTKNIYKIFKNEIPSPEGCYFTSEEIRIEAIISIISSAGEFDIMTGIEYPEDYLKDEHSRNQELFAILMSIYSTRDYFLLYRLKNYFNCEELVDSFINYINEASEKYNIPKDEELNSILKNDIKIKEEIS